MAQVIDMGSLNPLVPLRAKEPEKRKGRATNDPASNIRMNSRSGCIHYTNQVKKKLKPEEGPGSLPAGSAMKIIKEAVRIALPKDTVSTWRIRGKVSSSPSGRTGGHKLRQSLFSS